MLLVYQSQMTLSTKMVVTGDPLILDTLNLSPNPPSRALLKTPGTLGTMQIFPHCPIMALTPFCHSSFQETSPFGTPTLLRHIRVCLMRNSVGGHKEGLVFVLFYFNAINLTKTLVETIFLTQVASLCTVDSQQEVGLAISSVFIAGFVIPETPEK